MAFLTVEDIYGAIEVIAFSKIYERHAALLSEGNIVLIHGRLSLREEEAAKIVCETVEPCPPSAQAAKESSQRTVPLQKTTQTAQPEQKQPARKGLFLRFESEGCQTQERAQRVLDFFDGDKTVYFYFCDTGKYIRQPFSKSADVNAPMLRELERILGAENVRYIE